jgi:phage terminase Nu1 subunit (DNA packaging protein)
MRGWGSKVQETVTAEGLAHLLGVSAKTVRALARRGIVAKAGRNLFMLDESQNYCAHLRGLAHGRKEGECPTSERARLAAAQADAVELKNARTRGTLVDSEAVAREWEGICRTLRAGMLRIPKRAAAKLPHLTTQDVRAIDVEVRSVLNEVAPKWRESRAILGRHGQSGHQHDRIAMAGRFVGVC